MKQIQEFLGRRPTPEEEATLRKEQQATLNKEQQAQSELDKQQRELGATLFAPEVWDDPEPEQERYAKPRRLR